MSLPGLQLSAPAAEVAPPAVLTHDLPVGSEWRFELSSGQSIEVTVIVPPFVLTGSAELFGTELAPLQVYTFTSLKSCIYTYHGCRLSITGACLSEYLAEETPMTSYANLHFALEKLRQSSALAEQDGPRVLIVGPHNSGKTSLTKMLTAYAIKAGRQPVVVNLDPREAMLSLPGTLTATAMGSLMDVEEGGGWGSSPASGPSAVPVKLPLVYYWGGQRPEDEREAGGFKKVTSRLAVAVGARLKEDAEAREGGVLIDTGGGISQGQAGYDVIAHVVSEFSVNVLIVLGSERLYSDMARRVSTSAVTVLKLPKSGGAVDRDDDFMRQTRQAQVRSYFFGDAKRTLSPHTQVVDFAQLAVYKVREASQSHNYLAALRPGGDSDDEGDAKASALAREPDMYDLIAPSPSLQNAILALLHAEPHAAHATIRDASVRGFVYVVDVDVEKRKMRLLAPVAGRLEPCAMVWAGEREGVVVGLVG